MPYLSVHDMQSAAEFERQMAAGQSSGFSTVAYHAYDAVWTLAFGIER